MTVTLNHPDAIAEIEELMARFGLSAEVVIERVILDAGAWMPMEILAYPSRGAVQVSSHRVDEDKAKADADPLRG